MGTKMRSCNGSLLKRILFHSGASYLNISQILLGTRKRWKQWGRLLLDFDYHIPDMLSVTNEVIFHAGAQCCVWWDIISSPSALFAGLWERVRFPKTTYKLIFPLVALFSPQVLRSDDGSKLLPNCKYIWLSAKIFVTILLYAVVYWKMY